MIPQFSIESLNDEILMTTFFELNSDDDDPVYFDKLQGDILGCIQGYLKSYIGDQNIANREFVNKIKNDDPFDIIDENRYIKFEKHTISVFLNEYRIQSKGKEPFDTFVEYFSNEILRIYAGGNIIAIDGIKNSNRIQQKFSELFSLKYEDRALELRDDFIHIYRNTAKAIARNWIKQKVMKTNI